LQLATTAVVTTASLTGELAALKEMLSYRVGCFDEAQAAFIKAGASVHLATTRPSTPAKATLYALFPTIETSTPVRVNNFRNELFHNSGWFARAKNEFEQQRTTVFEPD